MEFFSFCYLNYLSYKVNFIIRTFDWFLSLHNFKLVEFKLWQLWFNYTTCEDRAYRVYDLEGVIANVVCCKCLHMI